MTKLAPQKSFSRGPIARTCSGRAATAVETRVGGRNDNEATKVRQRAMLEGPILPTLLKFAAPTVVVLVVQTLVTRAVGLFGADAIAGYGIASRLDYIQIPLLFALGSAALTMVGMNIGSGQIRRTERIAWVAAFFAAGATELLGLVVAICPHAWLTLFSTEPEVVAAGSIYFRTVAPFCGIAGLGMLLYFAGQGAGRVMWPVLAGMARLLIAAGIGWIVVAGFGGGLRELFIAVAAGSIVSSAIVASALWLRGWARPALP